jgi:hypothetical protein
MTELLNTQVPTAPGTTEETAVTGFGKPHGLSIVYRFSHGSGGTELKVYVQTSIDGGDNYFDVACAKFSTATENLLQNITASAISTPVSVSDAGLSDDSTQDGLLGDRFRVKHVTTGSYTGSNIYVDIFTRI